MCQSPFSAFGLLEKHETRCFIKERRKRNVDNNLQQQVQEQPMLAPVMTKLVRMTELVENQKKRAKLDPIEILSQRYPATHDFTLWKQNIILNVTMEHMAIILQQPTYVQGFLRLLTELMFPEQGNPDRCPLRTIANPERHLYCCKLNTETGDQYWTVWEPDNFSTFILLMDRTILHCYLKYEKQQRATFDAQPRTMWQDPEEIEEICYTQRKKVLHANITHPALCEMLYLELYRGMIQG